MNKYYKIIFKTTGLENCGYGRNIIEKVMGDELVKGHNEFARRTKEENIYSKLNAEFDKLYPDYEYKDDLACQHEYVEYINKGVQYIVDDMNKKKFSQILEFYMGPECNIQGRLRKFKDITIELFLKEA